MQDLPCCQCISSPEDFQYFYTIDRADYELQNPSMTPCMQVPLKQLIPSCRIPFMTACTQVPLIQLIPSWRIPFMTTCKQVLLIQLILSCRIPFMTPCTQVPLIQLILSCRTHPWLHVWRYYWYNWSWAAEPINNYMYAGTIDTIDPELQNPSMTPCMQELLIQLILSCRTHPRLHVCRYYWYNWSWAAEPIHDYMYVGTIDTIDPELQNPSTTTCM